MSGFARFAAFARVCALSAACLFAADASMLWLMRRGTSLSSAEWGRALVGSWASVWTLSLLGLLIVFLLTMRVGFSDTGADDERSLATRRLSLFVGILATFAFAWLLWTLTSGRRAQQLPIRPLWVILGALLLGTLSVFAVRAFLILRARSGVRGRVGLALLSVVGVFVFAWLDATVLTRGYPAFHATLALSSCIASLAFADACTAYRPLRGMWAWSALLFVGSAFAALLLASVCSMPAIHFVLSERAPLSGKLVRLLPVRSAPLITVPPHAQSVSLPDASHVDAALENVATQTGIDLRGQSVLLITVDALRADALRVSGGRGLTPNIDRLAREGVAFTRAYTSTPHTSYAITSILTGAFMRPVMELSMQGRPHDTVADIVRRHGVRTAAFYPPAVFFVDEDRFAAYRERGFGFEVRKEGFASGNERVGELREVLLATPTSTPLFAWVHLFEPHEPYEPPPGLAEGDSDRDLYDGEVRAADAAVGELVNAFRSVRPASTVIVTADHGEEFGEHGGQFHGTTLYEEQVRVPLVWSSPGALPAHEVSAPVENVDIVPTLLAALGVPTDPRMRGDDLSPLLQGSAGEHVRHAFASIHDEWMVTDGALKLVCAEGESCRLYDLRTDSSESRDASEAYPAQLAALRATLSEMIASVPRAENTDESAWPLALSQAELGDVEAAPLLVPLLGSPNVEVRRAAARFLGMLHYAPASTVLSRMRIEDSDEIVRAECAIAAASLGDAAALLAIRAFVNTAAPSDAAVDAGAQKRARLAALILAESGDASGVTVLVALARDAREEMDDRTRAVALLGRLRAREARRPLSDLLTDLSLRTAAADALGELGDRRALPALREALRIERYPGAREAEERAIERLTQRH